MEIKKEILEQAFEEVLEEKDIEMYEENYIGCGGYEREYVSVSEIIDPIITRYKTMLRDQKINNLTK